MKYEQAGATTGFNIARHGLGTWIEVIDGEKLIATVEQPNFQAVDSSALCAPRKQDSWFSTERCTDMMVLEEGSVL